MSSDSAGALDFDYQVTPQSSKKKGMSDTLDRLVDMTGARQIFVARYIPDMSRFQGGSANYAILENQISSKKPGFVSIVYLSRIAKMKNLVMTLSCWAKSMERLSSISTGH